MKLINADALKREIANVMPSRTEVFLVIDGMPDAIVRCKDCKNGHIGNSTEIVCELIDGDDRFHPYDWFCADGERKETT